MSAHKRVDGDARLDKGQVNGQGKQGISPSREDLKNDAEVV